MKQSREAEPPPSAFAKASPFALRATGDKSADKPAAPRFTARQTVGRQQPASQSRNASGRSFEYEVPKSGGGAEIKSVQQQTMDRSHPGQAHWEAGSVKTDPIMGKVRTTQHGRPKLTNDKSKVDY